MKRSMRISALIMAALTLVLLFAGRRTLQTRLRETMYSRAIPLKVKRERQASRTRAATCQASKSA